MKKILFLFIAWFILLNAINKISMKFLKDNTSYELPNNIKLTHRFWITPWLNFDGRNYLEIVVNGYQSKMQKTDLQAFFPLFPLLIIVFSLNKMINPVLIGLGISLSAFLASIYVFDKLLIQDGLDKKKRLKTIILLLLFPASFYFAAFYTESLFLFLTLLFFYFLNSKKYLLTSLCVALASVIRVTGLTLIPVLFFEAYQAWRKTKKFPFSIFISLIGYFIYSLYMQITAGNALSMVINHKDWGRNIQFFGFFIALKDAFLKVIFKSPLSKNNSLIYSIEVVEFVCAIFLIAILIFSFKKIKFSYWLYILISSVFIFSSSVLISIPRLIIPMFPVFIFISKTASKKVYYFTCLIFFILLIYLSSLFLRGYWVA